jgi:cullin 1
MIKSIVDSMGACLDLAVFEKNRGIEETHGATCFFLARTTVSLGLEDEQHHGGKDNKTHIEVYREHFQKPFLTATENYYKAESEGFLAENNISDYLRLAEKRLDEEENRVNLYMHSQTKQPVSRCLREGLSMGISELNL